MAGILDFFIPRERKFFDMLLRSSEMVTSSGELFIRLINGYDSMNVKERRELIDQIKAIEVQSDRLTHRIAIELNQTFITPFDREDIHELGILLDDIIDMFYNISHRLLLFNIQRMPKYLPLMASICYEASKLVHRILYNLARKAKVGSLIAQVHELESKCDELRNEALSDLFKDSYKAVDVLKIKDLYEWTESVSDKAEEIADVVESIVIKNA